MVISSIALLESFKKKKKDKSQNGKYLMSTVSVSLLIDFLAFFLQKAFMPGEKPQYK